MTFNGAILIKKTYSRIKLNSQQNELIRMLLNGGTV
jgi:hypothetical protein